jgi:fido (protein-threonine AMPylation protein)
LLPPFLFPRNDTAGRRELAKLKREGLVRAIGPRFYTSLPPNKVEEAVRASWGLIISELFPGTLLSHRSAFEVTPAREHEVILTSVTNRIIELPGLRLRFIRGPGPLPDDPHFLKFRMSSRSRMFLENLSTTHPTTRERNANPEKVEARLEQILHMEGEEGLVKVRDRAREIAHELQWSREFDRLDAMIGTLLGTRTSQRASDVGRARARGEPFDPRCYERLQALALALHAREFAALREPSQSIDHMKNKAFFEAYFSNFIEGTTFEIAEAESIVFDNQLPANRPKDAHDVAGTFRIVSDAVEMRTTPATFDEYRGVLQARHRLLMEARPEVAPGQFKVAPNRAGDTQFVHPDYVLGTLRKGFELYVGLRRGFARAAFMLFLVSDVHPFIDGNGRIARIMMNAELRSVEESSIIIPTLRRDDYITVLRALTRRHRPQPLIEMLHKAQLLSNLDFSSYPEILAELRSRHWFEEPDTVAIAAELARATMK